jgi:ABC-type multidrug transport system ATPase subunit
MTMGPLLVAEGIHKRYGRTPVLADARFEGRAGELVAILGENGSGKSTLLAILAGRMRPDRGAVRCAGRVGHCPQACVLAPHLTPDEHVALFAAAYGVAPDLARARAAELFERFDLARHRRKLARDLSGGTAQKLNLALALLHDPPLLLLDEPYAGFDHATYRRFLELADDTRRAGKCVVLVTHLVHEPGRFDAVHHLRDGALHASAS